jgi:hypothetical protein
VVLVVLRPGRRVYLPGKRIFEDFLEKASRKIIFEGF